jgi:hypothetical protein
MNNFIQTSPFPQALRLQYALAKALDDALTARGDYEKSLILDDSDLLYNAMDSARMSGYAAYQADERHDDAPKLLARYALLASCWKDGWNLAADFAETEECQHCNNGTGDPCAYHG